MVGERVDAVEVYRDAVNVVPTRRLQRPNSASRDGWSVLDHPSRPPADVSSGASHPTLSLTFPCAVTENGLDQAANSDTVGPPSGVYGPHPGRAGPPRPPITSHRDMGQVVPASEAIARLIFLDHILRNPAGA